MWGTIVVVETKYPLLQIFFYVRIHAVQCVFPTYLLPHLPLSILNLNNM